MKIKELCRDLEIASYPQHPLDDFAVNLFDTKRYESYHQSERLIDEDWEIPLDRGLVRHVNPDIDGFDKLGPNEKYVTNKILNASTASLLLVVGDLGVGKTGFFKYFMHSIMPRIVHRSVEKTKHCPMPIYLDFQRDGNFNVDFYAVKQEFADRFSDKLAAHVGHVISLREEITTVWDAILREQSDERRASNAAFDYIANRVRLEEVEPGAADPETTYQKRLPIRKGVEDRNYRLQYLAALLRYIKRTYFHGHEKCLLVLVDNIDPEPAVVQHAAKLVLKQFTGLSGVRVVATVRHTTYHHQFSDKGADAPDAAPFCSLAPLEIVFHRIDAFLKNSDPYRKYINAEAFDLVRSGIDRLRHEALSHDVFKALFSCLVGHSIRRGLMLAEHLINNSEYDLTQLGKRNTAMPLHLTSVLRAVMVGSKGVYEWGRGGVIENIFDVQAHKGASHLIKLRILKAVGAAGREGISFSSLNGLTDAFHYPAPLMCSAVGEMVEEPRGLLWCDTDLEYHDFAEIIRRHSHARLHLTPTGKGYDTTVYKKLEYIQEVMLDTVVEPNTPTEMGDGWDYGRLQGRFQLVYEFVRRLFIEDRMDMQTFISYNDPRAFRQRLGVYGLVSKGIIEGVRETSRRILEAAVKTRSEARELDEFRDQYLAGYDDLYRQAEEFERQSL